MLNSFIRGPSRRRIGRLIAASGSLARFRPSSP